MSKNAKKQKALLLGGTISLLAASLTLAGCASSSDPAASSTDPAQQHAIDSAPTDDVGKPVKTSGQDQVIKNKGEAGTLVDKSGKEVFSITVNSVKTASECVVRGFGGTMKPEKGTFLIVNITASMPESANKLVDKEKAVMPLGAENFGVSSSVDAAATMDLSSHAAFSCDVENPLDFQVEGGHTAKGNLVLDSPLKTGQLSYSPQEEGGWVWPF
ncbi:hypothetical protein [Neomicrococcus aestuarii]|uniref:DUF4352 domain-containing protein n=1 Tax=Neomicrococcus aestuarii TaxID=556325 RepID=A0A1L2ZQA4_9MICC|nr:hypothetical protein [Neomicrococcus aestuarii]APF41564.1 hypothetical protein BHE16_11845 [Neomicrococcus aestuarii]MBB5513634.1 hypothetical protein [Neomicrococcus aestuarii]